MFKTKEEVIIIQAEAKEPIRTDAVFWSHDKGTAKMLFKLRKDGTSQALAEGTIVPIVLKFNSETAEGGIGRHIYHAVIEDAVNGIVSIVLEDNILGYVGRVDGSIYIELPDSRSLDTAGRFTFHIKRSPIDEDVPELENYYWQGFSDIMEQYHESIAEIKLEAKTTLDSLTADVTTAKTKVSTLEQSINTANTNLNTRIDEINKKIDDNDVFTKAESSANVIDNIAGTEVVTFKKEFLVNGVEATAARDDNGTLIAFNEDDYTKLITNDSYVRTETLVSGRGAATKYTFPIISTVASKYPAAFAHLSLSEKITYFLSILKSVKIKMVHRGGGPLKTVESNNYKSRGYIQTAGGGRWGLGSILASSDNFTTQNHTLDAAAQRQIISDGTYVIWHVSQMIGYPNEAGVVSDGVTPAWIECKEIILTVEFSLNGKTIIESMIAQNHVDNLATQIEATAATDNTKTMTPLRTKQLLDSKLLNMVYPIGSIYMSVNSATPATLFGGTWERFSNGRVLVGVNESDTALATSGKQGGSANGIAEHTHTFSGTTGYTSIVTGVASGADVSFSSSASGGGIKSSTHTHGFNGTTVAAGSNTDHANWQPFTTVYIWKRTA